MKNATDTNCGAPGDFPRPGVNSVFGAPTPTQPVHGSIDAKNELGIKGRRKLTLESPIAYV